MRPTAFLDTPTPWLHRPLNRRELDNGATSIIEVNEEKKEVRLLDEKKAGASGDTFVFDQVFGPDSTQEGVYAVAVQPVVDQVVRGLSCCIFAYGQTGTGKTYTMLGDLTDPYVCSL